MAIKVMINLVVFSLVMVAVALVQSSRAETSHVVGDTLGWVVPPAGSIAYSTWAANQTFAVGDTLVFNFATGAHDVAEVSKTAYDGCNKTNVLSNEATGPANVNLTTAGEHFFICTFGTHCNNGQKLAINVSTTATSSPSPPGTTTTTTSPPPPPPSAAQPLAIAAALPITLVSIVLALLH